MQLLLLGYQRINIISDFKFILLFLGIIDMAITPSKIDSHPPPNRLNFELTFGECLKSDSLT